MIFRYIHFSSLTGGSNRPFRCLYCFPAMAIKCNLSSIAQGMCSHSDSDSYITPQPRVYHVEHQQFRNQQLKTFYNASLKLKMFSCFTDNNRPKLRAETQSNPFSHLKSSAKRGNGSSDTLATFQRSPGSTTQIKRWQVCLLACLTIEKHL